MSTTIYNKLVRDKIPDIISNNPNTKIIKISKLNDDLDYMKALLSKLTEEVDELKKAYFYGEGSLIEELADIQEVLDTFAGQLGFDQRKINTTQKDKGTEKGKFKARIFLEYIETHD